MRTPTRGEQRSEEHTSELQSRQYLVCRLLLDTPPPHPSPLSLHDALPIFRHRPVLPVHRRQMGHRRTRRTHPALHRPALAAVRNRAPVTTAGTRVIPLVTGHAHADARRAEIGRAHV